LIQNSCVLASPDLRKTDTGVYTCRAVSETGETARGAALIVETPSNPAVIFHRTPEPSTFPGAPSKPSVSEITENSVRLAWRPSTTHGASPIVAYTVEYFSHDTLEVVLHVLYLRHLARHCTLLLVE
jgi:roundabout, axon guidance receptor 2